MNKSRILAGAMAAALAVSGCMTAYGANGAVTSDEITEREQNLTGALHPRDAVINAPDKDKVVNGGHQHALGLTLIVLSLPGQWKEILHMMAVEEIPDLQGAPAVAMGNTHGEPLFEFIGNTFIKNTIGGHRANNILRRGNRRF